MRARCWAKMLNAPAAKPAPSIQILFDEFHQLPDRSNALYTAMETGFTGNKERGGVVVTPALYWPNGARQPRFLSSMRSLKTGLPLKPVPKKFFPAEVLRRQKGA